MANIIQSPKGTVDILPAEIGRWNRVEALARDHFAAYGYSEIRTPVYEFLDLFVRGVGEQTDIVSKEMFAFERRDEKGNADRFALRPENTAGVVRAYIQNKLYTQSAPQKLWYLGPMFRAERPQKGRQRQFYQLGVECLATEDPRYDAEAILLAVELLAQLGLTGLEVQLNSVGCPTCRPVYREKLQAHLRSRTADLCSNCVVRTEKNPLRVLDCKVPSCAPVIQEAPALSESLCEECRTQLATVERLLSSVGVAYVINPRLVRGLDYYSRTVFEIIALSGLGSQNTVCAGGRYNQLVEELGGPATPAVGWALGMERLLLLMPEDGSGEKGVEALFMPRTPEGAERAFVLARELRRAGVGCEIASPGKMDKQFKQAERLKARFGLILGEDELAAGTITVKDLEKRAQSTVTQQELVRLMTEGALPV